MTPTTPNEDAELVKPDDVEKALSFLASLCASYPHWIPAATHAINTICALKQSRLEPVRLTAEERYLVDWCLRGNNTYSLAYRFAAIIDRLLQDTAAPQASTASDALGILVDDLEDSSELTDEQKGKLRAWYERSIKDTAGEGRDACQFCLGAKGGVPGNENMICGVVMCDYCHSLYLETDEKTKAASGKGEGGLTAEYLMSQAPSASVDHDGRGNPRLVLGVPAPKPSGDKGVVGEIAKRHRVAFETIESNFFRETFEGLEELASVIRDMHADRATLLALHKPLAERREGLAQHFYARNARHDKIWPPFEIAGPFSIPAYEEADALIAWIEGANK